MTLTVSLDVDADGWKGVPAVDDLVDRALVHAERYNGHPLREGAEVSVLLCDDATIRQLNRDWRGKDKATNVLSFAAPGLVEQRFMLGDIAVAWETTEREARAEGKPVANHLAHLLVHGLLHLVGFDHETDDEATNMEGLEVRILAELGIPDPYRGFEHLETNPL